MKFIHPVACLLIVIAFFASKSLSAQTPAFKLSDYKNPDYLYQTLDLNFDLNSGLILDKIYTNSITSDKTFSLNSGAGAIYSRYVNTPKTQAELHTSFDVGFGSSSYHRNRDTIDFNGTSANYSHQEALQFWGIKRIYNAKQNYIEFDGGINTFYQSYNYSSEFFFRDTINTSYEGYQRRFTADLRGSVIIGKGRIEQVQDARLAMYILEDLQKLNREKRLASDEDVLAFAREITLLKYKRFFDNRLRKIAEITAIDAFLQKNGLAGTSDAAYFTALNDNWDFANNPVRNSGKRIYAGLDANYIFNYLNAYSEHHVPYNELDENTHENTQGGLFLVFGIDYEKPKSLIWQNSSSFRISAGMESRMVTEKASDIADESNYYITAIPALNLAADYGFGYYPNSRTWLTFRWWMLCGWNKEMDGDTKEGKEDFQNIFYSYTGPQFNAYFYLSEKLRLNLTFNGEFRIDDTKYTHEVIEGNPEKVTSTWWNQQVNAALTYSLF